MRPRVVRAEMHQWSMLGLGQRRGTRLENREAWASSDSVWREWSPRSRGRIHLSLAFGGELGVTWGKGDARAVSNDKVTSPAFRIGVDVVLAGWALGTRALGRVRLGLGYALGIEAQVQKESLGDSGTLATRRRGVGCLPLNNWRAELSCSCARPPRALHQRFRRGALTSGIRQATSGTRLQDPHSAASKAA